MPPSLFVETIGCSLTRLRLEMAHGTLMPQGIGQLIEVGQIELILPCKGPFSRGWDQELEGLRRNVIEGRGFALIRGLSVDRYRIEEAATAYFGIGTWFGSARS